MRKRINSVSIIHGFFIRTAGYEGATRPQLCERAGLGLIGVRCYSESILVER